MKCLTLIFVSSEFACFVAGEIIQVLEAMPGFFVPLAMFLVIGLRLLIFGRNFKKFFVLV